MILAIDYGKVIFGVVAVAVVPAAEATMADQAEAVTNMHC